MGRARKTKILQVVINGKKVGELKQTLLSELSFSYTTTWIQQKSDFQISRLFPVLDNTYKGSAVKNYFENLLPDNKIIREKIAAKAGVENTNIFDLLWAIGRDCAGAFQFIPEGEKIPKIAIPQGKKIINKEIEKILTGLKQIPLGFDTEEDFRISLAGAQEKTAFLKLKQSWFIPKKSTPTTHIFKPTIGLMEQKDMRLSVENEWLCSKICKLFNLSVAESEIATFGHQKVLVVQRFDRQWENGKLYRLPTEDLCQVFGVAPHLKYENDGGPGIKKIMTFLNESAEKEKDRKYFLKAQIVFWLLAAIDGHAKNFSIFWRPGGFFLTPLYDVLSAEPMFFNKSLNPHKAKLAMAVGNKKHYHLKNITGRHWMQTANEAGISDLQFKLLTEEIINEAKKIEKTLLNILPQYFPIKEIYKPVLNGIKKRIEFLY